jgi:hypothetical protein
VPQDVQALVERAESGDHIALAEMKILADRLGAMLIAHVLSDHVRDLFGRAESGVPDALVELEALANCEKDP